MSYDVCTGAQPRLCIGGLPSNAFRFTPTPSSAFPAAMRPLKCSYGSGGALFQLGFLYNCSCFVCTGAVFAFERETAGLRRIAGYGVTMTRGAASAMMFTYASMLVTMCRNLITFLRDTFLHVYIPFDDAVSMHKFIAFQAAVFTRQSTPLCVGVGDGRQGRPKYKENIFWGKYHVKFGHFVNFSYIYFRAKMSCSSQVD